MKAYRILMFLMIFNLFFWTVTAPEGLNLFNVDVTGEEKFGESMEESKKKPTEIGMGLISVFSMFGGLYLDIFALAIAVSGGAMIGFLVSGQGAQGAVYLLFGYFFWASYLKTMTLFYNLSNTAGEVLYIVFIFSMIVGVVFTVGLFQMVTGGWKGHE